MPDPGRRDWKRALAEYAAERTLPRVEIVDEPTIQPPPPAGPPACVTCGGAGRIAEFVGRAARRARELGVRLVGTVCRDCGGSGVRRVP